MPTIWDHDLWQDIYAIDDPETKQVMIRLYRLVLDMHNKDILSAQIADALKGERRLYFSFGQKIAGGIVTLILAADTLVHIFMKG